MIGVLFTLIQSLLGAFRPRGDLLLENLALRHQLTVLFENFSDQFLAMSHSVGVGGVDEIGPLSDAVSRAASDSWSWVGP
jgi:hypothetical protein